MGQICSVQSGECLGLKFQYEKVEKLGSTEEENDNLIHYTNIEFELDSPLNFGSISIADGSAYSHIILVKDRSALILINHGTAAVLIKNEETGKFKFTIDWLNAKKFEWVEPILEKLDGGKESVIGENEKLYQTKKDLAEEKS